MTTKYKMGIMIVQLGKLQLKASHTDTDTHTDTRRFYNGCQGFNKKWLIRGKCCSSLMLGGLT